MTGISRTRRRRAGCIITAVLLMAGVTLFYLWPVPNPPFEQLYAGVEPAKVEALRAFRAAHPLRAMTVNGNEWRYLVVGEGKHTILLLHGMTGAPDIWFQQMNALKREYRLIAVTYPAVSTLKEMDAGIMAILDREGVQQLREFIRKGV